MFGIVIILITEICLFWYLILGYKLLQALISQSGRNRLNFRLTEVPKVSIVVALRDEEENLPGLMQHLTQQQYPDFEVVLVDDNSTDCTRSLAEKYQSQHPNLKIIPAGENLFGWGPKKNALHSGIEASSGSIILTTDADCRPGKFWVQEMVSALRLEIGAVVGYSPLRFAKGLSGRLKSLEALASGIISSAFILRGSPYLATGRNLAYRKSLYQQIGGFNEKGKSPAGDDDLLIQSMGQSAKVAFNFHPDAIVPSFPEGSRYLGAKRRHFYSARYYKLKFIIMGMMACLLIGGMCLSILYGIFSGNALMVIIGALSYILKMAVDYSVLVAGARKLNDSFKKGDFLLAQALQIPYTLILQPLSLVGGIEWRGRRW